MEQLLHYVWKHKIFPLMPLQTTSGQPVEVIEPGLPNTDAGPDFFNAKLKIDGTLWVGNVELHTQASDWFRHGHDRDTAYDNVILYVVGGSDCEVYHTNGDIVPQLLLRCPDNVRQRYEQKAQAVTARLERCNNHWEDVFFITLARNLGFGLNGDAFEAWANHLPFRAVDKHRDSLFQVEAFFLGQAGLLEEDFQEDSYHQKLRKEFHYLQHKFELPVPMTCDLWSFLRLRPGNFPHVRLAQLAWLYHKEQSLFSRVMAAETPEDVKKILSAQTSTYWEEHFTFKKASPHREKRLGENALNLILINTVIPFLYTYGIHKADEELCERATRFLEALKAENNYVTRLWSGAGLPVYTAADSQALLQLQKEYCDKKDCLHCRFGYEYLKSQR